MKQFKSYLLKEDIKDVLLSVQAVDKKGDIITIHSKDIKFEYRNKKSQNGKIIYFILI